MKLTSSAVVVVIIGCLIAGCAYLQKPDVPPPLPPIEETKPPLTMKGTYFQSFPWAELPKPVKDGNDPDTFLYTSKEGDTLESVAEKNMGDRNLAARLAAYNGLTPSASLQANEKIVIPYPIIGVSTQLLVKEKGDKDFSKTQAVDTRLKQGDQYKIRLESNINGYCYVFREGPKGVTFLYPAQAKQPPERRTGRKPTRQKPPEPLLRDTGKVDAHQAIDIPTGKAGIPFDPKAAGDKIWVFLSIKEIPGLEDLKEKKSITVGELQDVMHNVKESDIFSEQPYKLLRISDPKQVLGFTLNLRG
jgi:hypothetical protein